MRHVNKNIILISFFSVQLSGGRAALAQSLNEKTKKINFQSPPFCCFFYCLPKANPTMYFSSFFDLFFHFIYKLDLFRTNLTRLEWIVLQAPIIRVLIVFGQVVVVAEAREDSYK